MEKYEIDTRAYEYLLPSTIPQAAAAAPIWCSCFGAAQVPYSFSFSPPKFPLYSCSCTENIFKFDFHILHMIFFLALLGNHKRKIPQNFPKTNSFSSMQRSVEENSGVYWKSERTWAINFWKVNDTFSMDSGVCFFCYVCSIKKVAVGKSIFK